MKQPTDTNANPPILPSPDDCTDCQDRSIDQLAAYWYQVKEKLFPLLESNGSLELTPGLKRLVQILEIVRIEERVAAPRQGGRGRKPLDRRPLARALLAKAVLNLPSTSHLIESLRQSVVLRGICGMDSVASEATFSRVFADFAKEKLCDRVHEAMVSKFISGKIVMHSSHDTTAVEAREKGKKKPKKATNPPSAPPKSVEGPEKERFESRRSRLAWNGRCRWSRSKPFVNCQQTVIGASRRTPMATPTAGAATRLISFGPMA